AIHRLLIEQHFRVCNKCLPYVVAGQQKIAAVVQGDPVHLPDTEQDTLECIQAAIVRPHRFAGNGTADVAGVGGNPGITGNIEFGADVLGVCGIAVVDTQTVQQFRGPDAQTGNGTGWYAHAAAQSNEQPVDVG